MAVVSPTPGLLMDQFGDLERIEVRLFLNEECRYSDSASRRHLDFPDNLLVLTHDGSVRSGAIGNQIFGVVGHTAFLSLASAASIRTASRLKYSAEVVGAARKMSRPDSFSTDPEKIYEAKCWRITVSLVTLTKYFLPFRAIPLGEIGIAGCV